MSYPNFGHNDTLTTHISVNIPDLDFSSDYAEKETGKANEKLYAYIKSPADQPESIRLAIQDVKNVYTGTDIQPGLYSVIKQGKSVLTSVRSTLRTNPSTGVFIDYPVQTGITMKFPVCQEVTDATLVEVLTRNLGVMTTAQGTFGDRIKRFMRGALEL